MTEDKLKREKDPTKYCMECGSKNIKRIYEGLETDQYECQDCKAKYGVTMRLL